MKMYNLAATFYKKSLSMDPTEYKNSISQKAEAGLNRINR